jgi:hypothetical protein
MIRIPYNIKPSDARKYWLKNQNDTFRIESSPNTLTNSGSPQNAYFVKTTDIAGDNPELLAYLLKNSSQIQIQALKNQTHYLINDKLKIVFSDGFKKFANANSLNRLLEIPPKIIIGIENDDRQIKIQRSAYAAEKFRTKDDAYSWFIDLYDNHTLGSYFEITMDDKNNSIIIDYRGLLEQNSNLANQVVIQDEIKQDPYVQNTSKNPIIGKNVIFYGVPGNGKSHKVDQEVNNKKHERILFHPDYTYADFIGQTLPSNNQNGEPTYEFKPGVFTLILEQALLNPNEEHYLVIEEINRGNASGIFGDLFQLLDRTQTGDSRFSISNTLISKYLFGKKLINSELNKIKIPNNLFIYGTMNTSDQNVFQLDTSFKRRWEFKFVKNDILICGYRHMFVPGTAITWESFHFYINKKITSNQGDISSFDDKQIGPFFIGSNLLSPIKNDRDVLKNESFSHKLLEYLWNDVSKLSRDLWFGHINPAPPTTLQKLIEIYLENDGFDLIFNDFNTI